MDDDRYADDREVELAEREAEYEHETGSEAPARPGLRLRPIRTDQGSA